MPIDQDINTAVDQVPLVEPNVISERDSLNQLILALSSPDRDRPTQELDQRVPLADPTSEGFDLTAFLSGVRTALVNIGAAVAEGE